MTWIEQLFFTAIFAGAFGGAVVGLLFAAFLKFVYRIVRKLILKEG